MIVVTGAAGFIGSCLVSLLNRKGYTRLILVDAEEKRDCKNLKGKAFIQYIDRLKFFEWLPSHAEQIEFIFHIGARTDTTEWDESVFDQLNVSYSQKLWNFCADYDIPFLYASSAATYGMGKHGYSDDHGLIPLLEPLNPYGWSKQKMDQWVLTQDKHPSRWAGFKFFNVFGPNEYHKGRMASVIYHAYQQIRKTGQMRLFKSNDLEIKDGEQRRDFIYVLDVIDVLFDFFENPRSNGIYNLGSGEANTFKNLVEHTFQALECEPSIVFVDMPTDLLKTYQNFTCAEITKLRSAGYDKGMHAFGIAINDYVQRFLMAEAYY